MTLESSPIQYLFLSAQSETPYSTRIINPHNKAAVWKFNGSEYQNGIPDVVEPLGENPDYFIASIKDQPLLHLIGLWTKQRLHVKSVVPAHVSAICTDPNGCFIFGAISETIYIWNAMNRELIAIIQAQFLKITVLKCSHDGNFIISGAEDGSVSVYRLADIVALQTVTSLKPIPYATYTEHRARITDLYITTSNQPRILSTCANHTAIIYSLIAKCLLMRIVEDFPISSCTMDSAESKIFLGLDNGNITVVSLSKQPLRREEQHPLDDSEGSITKFPKKHEAKINKMAVNFDGSMLVTCDINGKYFIWDVASKTSFVDDSFHGPIITAKFIRPWNSVFDPVYIPPKSNNQPFHKGLSGNNSDIPVLVTTKKQNETDNVLMEKTLNYLIEEMEDEINMNKVADNTRKVDYTSIRNADEKIAALEELVEDLQAKNKELYEMCSNIIADD